MKCHKITNKTLGCTYLDVTDVKNYSIVATMNESPGLTIIEDFDPSRRGSYNRNETIFWYIDSDYLGKWIRKGVIYQ